MKPKIVQSGDSESLNVLGIEHILHVEGSETNGTVVFAEARVPPGAGIPRHVHTREDEIFHVLDGQVTFTVNGRQFTATRDTTVFGPRNVPHGWRADGTSPARILVVITPGTLDAMFRELSLLPAGPPDTAKVAEIVERYGISFV